MCLPHQVPPVDGGRIFHEWTKLFGKKLSLCRRTDNLQLQENGAAILRGDVDCFFASVDWEETFSQDWLDRLYEQINPLISEDPIDPDHCFTQFTQFRVLNALRQGSFGVDALNQEIFRRMEKKCPEGWWWAVPILSTANLPAINLSNGSFGVIIGRKKGRIDLSKGSAYFEEHRGEKSPRLPSYELSFLLSVHKSQGSEFNEVLAIFPDGSESFGKEILYTAATRAKLRWKGMGPKKVIAQLLVSLRL
jgi:exodeoxyribonuclease V alpha subunit